MNTGGQLGMASWPWLADKCLIHLQRTGDQNPCLSTVKTFSGITLVSLQAEPEMRIFVQMITVKGTSKGVIKAGQQGERSQNALSTEVSLQIPQEAGASMGL